MKWTASLIRITEHEIEGLRRRVAEISERRVACERLLIRLAEEALAETAHARLNAEAGWYLVGFREGWKQRKARALADLAAIALEEEGARDALARSFEDLKKVEQVAETAKKAKAKEAARKEGAAYDELGLQRRS